MIDLHSHILPGLDDGPPDEAGSVALALAAAGGGTEVIAATPHLHAAYPNIRPEAIKAQCIDLERRLADASIPLTVVPGGEVAITWAQTATDDELRCASFGGRGSDILLETPHEPLPSLFEELLLGVIARGFRIVLAHPERNPTFQREPERLAALVRDQGVLLQITAMSLSRKQRAPDRRLAHALLADGLAHIIASDAHSAGGRRGPDLREAVAAGRAASGDRAIWAVTEAPAAVLSGDQLPKPPTEGARRRGGLSLPLRR